MLIRTSEWLDLKEWARGLACLVLLFDIYTVYQQLQLQRIRRELTQRNQLFEVITGNAADMIAVVDCAGNRLYNSPAYQKVLGYFVGGFAGDFTSGANPPEDRVGTRSGGESATHGAGDLLEISHAP